MHDPQTRRSDLAIPLNECGTGVGQVLAILYVVLTSARGSTILIDEPTSFLHPGAVRKLLQVVKEHGGHQFIISTHSPSVISLLERETMWITRSESGSSTVSELSASSRSDITLFLEEIGASLGDVFGADSVIWVEGATEAKVQFQKTLTHQR